MSDASRTLENREQSIGACAPSQNSMMPTGGLQSPMIALENRVSSSSMAQVTVYGNIAELPGDVRDFIATTSADELCLSALWFELLMRYSPAPGQQARIYVVRGELSHSVDCVMFAMNASDQRRPRKLASLTNFYTMRYAPLLRGSLDNPRDPLDKLAAYIVREQPFWDVIELHSFIEENVTTGHVVKAFRQAGMLVDTFAQFENWIYPSDGMNAETYFVSRPPPVRAITRKMRQAQKKHAVSFQLYDGPKDLEIGLADYESVYSHSWKNAEAFPEFVPQLIRQSAARGQLRLGILRLDDQPAAAQIWFITGRRATIYKVAYDEKFAVLSAGSLLSKLMFDHVIDHDKVGEIDYGVGSERYKRDWMSECRHVVGLVCFNPRSMAGLAAAARHYGGRLRRRLLGNASSQLGDA